MDNLNELFQKFDVVAGLYKFLNNQYKLVTREDLVFIIFFNLKKRFSNNYFLSNLIDGHYQ